MKAYAALEAHFKTLSAIKEAASILDWDNAVLLPKGAQQNRADQLTALARVAHDMATDPRIGDWLNDAEADTSLNPWQRANLAEISRSYRREMALPADLIAAETQASNACEALWRQARAEGDYALVLPKFQEVWRLARERASILAETFDLSPYDALLDMYEPHGRSAAIDPVFADYRAFLADFLPRVLEAQRQRPALQQPEGPFPIPQQEALGKAIMTALGFDFDQGRLDVSTHPFCGGTPDDVRMTTRYGQDDFSSALMGVIHETGHGLYEQGLPRAYRHQPVGGSRGMTLHESQSLFWEMQIGRSHAFLRFLEPQLRQAFGRDDPAFAAPNLQHLYTRVQPGYIRVDADEVTYPAHVILRYQLEQDLLADDLLLQDLPQAWADGFEALLGLKVSDPRQGCLQDIHWYMGAIGYFPTYTLGAMAAAQLADAVHRALPNLDALLAEGEFAPVLAWMRQHVHAQASALATDEILSQATGQGLKAEAFKKHLYRRYLPEEA